MFSKFFYASAFLFIFAGCASMFGESVDDITIESEPSGADVYFRNRYLGKTPLQTNLARTPEAPFLVFKKEGYAEQKVTLGRSLDGAAFFNLGFITTTSGATSWGIDAITGRMWKVNPSTYVVKLERVRQSSFELRPQVLEFVLARGEEIKKEISRSSSGENLQNLCVHSKLNQDQCGRSIAKIMSDKQNLLNQPNSLELYRKLYPHLSHQEVGL